MRETRVIIQCDRCESELSLEHQTDEIIVTLGGQRTVYLGEFCDGCRGELHERMSDLEVEFALRVEETKQIPDPSKTVPGIRNRKPKALTGVVSPYANQCQICGHVSTSDGGLRQHVNKKHGLKMSEYKNLHQALYK